jgi:hypothetical protein
MRAHDPFLEPHSFAMLAGTGSLIVYYPWRFLLETLFD